MRKEVWNDMKKKKKKKKRIKMFEIENKHIHQTTSEAVTGLTVVEQTTFDLSIFGHAYTAPCLILNSLVLKHENKR